jgi:DNA uptake protein ComE-like DNA-binding protein
MKKLAALISAVLTLLVGSPAFAAEGKARIDLNTASIEQITETLGVSVDEAQRIIEARPYQKREDLMERGILSADDFEKLKRLIESVC